MANREGKEGWPISAVVRADWHAFTQNQVPEVEWGAEGSLRWVRWVGSLGGWLAGWVPVAGWLAWWLGSWPAGWVAGWVTGLVAWCLGCWLGGFGAWADWDSAGLGLGWGGCGRLAARLDWAWTWADWASAGLGSVDWARLGGSTGARLARLGLGSIGARARVDWASVHVNWSEGWIGAWLDWGVVGLGAAGSGTIVSTGE